MSRKTGCRCNLSCDLNTFRDHFADRMPGSKITLTEDAASLLIRRTLAASITAALD